MTLPIWKRQALYVLWYEDQMYDAWCGRGTDVARNYHLTIAETMKKLVDKQKEIFSGYAPATPFNNFYANMQSMLKDLAAMICKSKDSLAYYNWVEVGHLRCACSYDCDDKRCNIEFSVVPPQSMSWYWKKNICSINSVRKSARCGLHNRVNDLVGKYWATKDIMR